MAEGTGGLPGLPKIDMAGNKPIQTDVSAKNIFDLIKQGATESYTSVLPYIQSQFAAQSQAAAPQIAGMRESGEIQAAQAQSDAGARGMRGSDIEAAGMSGARMEAGKREAEFRSKLAMQEAQFMAESIMTTYGYDIQQNTQLYTNLAQAIGQELSQQRELQMRRDELKAFEKEMKKNRSSSLLSSIIEAAGGFGSGYIEGMIKKG